ncbi:unnamed protein product [Rhizoctonia solani]|uniref:F-box domain-containing protein n=1 Tax=Rhizoctonia solani TaxID=456999 RepID=A0A8H2ZZE4_9AGAM|nr:unnamed protein product [Rhizoctonia solani]
MLETTSTSLVRTRRKQVDRDPGEISHTLARDAGENYIDPEREEHQPPPRKRQRAASTKEVTRKKQRRSKQGDLAGLINMPIEILAEVASHLHAADILSLARSSRLLRNLLMNRSAVYIWHRAMRNVKDLPPCPPEISEPYYVSLLFSRTCSACGVMTRVHIEPLLLVRLCTPCQCTYLIPLSNVPTELSLLALHSININRARPNPYKAHAPHDYLRQLLAEYEEKKRSNDVNALQAWKDEKLAILERRNDLARSIIEFLETVRSDRAQEARETGYSRESAIISRMKQIGWSEEDLGFTPYSPIWERWRHLVEAPRPLTDHVWARIGPKLISLLEENREYRLTMESGNRRNMRHFLLYDLLTDIYTKGYSAITLKARNPIAQFATIDFTHRGPFPSLNHAFNWPIVRTLYGTDFTEEEMIGELDKHRDEIEALVAEWVGRIQTHFVNQLCKGYMNQAEPLRPAITMHDIGQPANIPDHLKYLLRADSFFCRIPSHPSGWPPEPLSYDTFIATAGLGKFHSKDAYPELWPAPKLDNIVWYPSAHCIAQELLFSMGRLDATYLEMMSVGPQFAYCASKAMASDSGIGKSLLGVCNICKLIPGAEEVVVTSPPVMLKHLLDVHGIFNPEVNYHYSVRPNEQ